MSSFDSAGRKTPAAGAHIFLDKPNIFFLTVCAKDRVEWLATDHSLQLLQQIWRETATAWRVGYFLLMPDHIHLFCVPYDLRFTIDDWIKFWKSEFGRHYMNRPGDLQRRAFHRRMRGRIDYEDQLQYVRENPMRKGLVPDLDTWRFQGHAWNLILNW